MHTRDYFLRTKLKILNVFKFGNSNKIKIDNFTTRNRGKSHCKIRIINNSIVPQYHFHNYSISITIKVSCKYILYYISIVWNNLFTTNKPLGIQNIIHKLKRYFWNQKPVLNASLKDSWYTNLNQTKIWYNKFNKYAFKAKTPPTLQESLTLNKHFLYSPNQI